MPRFYCPTSTGVFHDWSEGEVDPAARPTLRLCPEHDGTPSAGVQPLPPGEEAIGEPNKPAEEWVARTITGAHVVSPEAKTLWEKLEYVIKNEEAWAIIEEALRAAEERGANREPLWLRTDGEGGEG